MAYTFDQINGLMGQNGEQKTDIFSQQQPQQPQGGMQGSQPSQTGQQSGNAPQADSSGGGGGSSAPSQAPKPVTNGQNASQADVLSKNQLAAQPGFTQTLQQNIGKAQGDLQNEANTYLDTQAKGAQGTLDKGVLDQAVGGDAHDYQSVQNYLNNNTKNADAYNSNVDTKFGQLDTLNNKNSLQSYLTQQGPETYNKGMASLDAQIMSTDPKFQQSLQQAKSQRDALQQLQQQYQGGQLQSQAQSTINNEIASGQQQARDYLNSRLNTVNSTMAQEAAAENSARAGLKATPDQGYIDSQVQNAYKELTSTNPELAQYLPQSGTVANNDSSKPSQQWANQFYNPGGDVTPQQAASYDDVFAYNKLNGLLNNSSQLSQSGTGNRQSIDYNGLKNQMVQMAQNAKRAADLQKEQGMANTSTELGLPTGFGGG